MNTEFFKQAMGMFDTPEKWNAYLELFLQTPHICSHWYQKFRESANKRFHSENGIVAGWTFESWGEWDMIWYLTAYGDKSISLLLGWSGELNLWCDGNFFDISKVHELLKTDKFAPLLSPLSFDRFFLNDRLAIETRKFYFGSPYDNKFDYHHLAWFAGNRTEEFVDQIEIKVNYYRKNKSICDLLNELNKMTKKKIV